MENLKIKVTEIKMTREQEKEFSEILRSYENSEMNALADNIKYFNVDAVKMFIDEVNNGLCKKLRNFSMIIYGQNRFLTGHYKNFKCYSEKYNTEDEKEIFKNELYKHNDEIKNFEYMTNQELLKYNPILYGFSNPFISSKNSALLSSQLKKRGIFFDFLVENLRKNTLFYCTLENGTFFYY